MTENKENKQYTYDFKVALKTFKLEGYLAYEYNPLHNYRLKEDVVFYKGEYIKIQDFLNNNKYIIDGANLIYKEGDGIYENDKPISNINNYLKDKTQTFIFYKKGQLVDFITDELKFDLNNPVNIIPQWSYDNSVNLILNDGKNPPRLINTRFSPTERNLYQICDRKGNNDTNIYNQGEQFDIDTSLYKKVSNIPELEFLGVTYGGNLSIGNYHFYFKYVDDDGNESDFFAESGLVSIFIGNRANSIKSGFRNENSHKLIKFLLNNLDPAYNKIVIYYTIATSDIYQNITVSAYKIEQPFNTSSLITITGFEDILEITLDDINMQYLIYGAAETQETALNMLFMANLEKPKTPYEDLADCALHFLPKLKTELYNDTIQNNYQGSIKNTYYDPNYIYNKVGYWDDEIYRFGVVFIKNDNTLTEVFNVRGRDKLSEKENEYIDFDFTDNGKRTYIPYDEFTYKTIPQLNNSQSNDSIDRLENVKGVVRFKHANYNDIIGITFQVKEEVINYLKNNLGIKGLFFVRLKRIPTTLCQAYTIGVDNLSHTPVLPIKNRHSTDDSSKDENFLTEGFLNNNLELVHDFDSRKIRLPEYQCSGRAAICPEYDVNSPYLNNLFSGSEHSFRASSDTILLSNNHILFFPENNFQNKEVNYHSLKVLGVEDNVKLVAINDEMFSARAGEAEEGFRYEYAGSKKVDEKNRNLLRGSYGPYLALTGSNIEVGKLIDIKIPDYNENNMEDYFKIRFSDKTSYYAISNRIDLYKNNNILYKSSGNNKFEFKDTFYRGDCYICKFTHRFNRNFQDPSAPTNSEIVDPNCWKDNFKIEDGVVKKEEFEKINLGDLNAVQLGMYITLNVRSTINLNIRAVDESIVSETAMTGHPRGFYPYFPLTTSGTYKTPEALCYNKGFEKSTSERYNKEVSDVPWIRNEFSNRICYSNVLVQDSFLNGWRTFMGGRFRDYPKTYGSITKLIELGGNLLCVFEHGVGLISVNERAIGASGTGGYAYINTANVLPLNPTIISDKIGSQWRDSVIKTPTAVYGVDTIAKKIWKTNGSTIEYISDFRVLEFLNRNITLTERELTPIIGVRNVKTHYNAFKGDVMFTFYDNLYGFSERVWNLCWNEKMLKFITFYSWVPSYSENIWNSYFSFDRNTSKWIAKLGISQTNNNFADGITVSNVVIPYYEGSRRYKIGELNLTNRIPEDEIKNYTINYELERDNYGNYKYFLIDKDDSGKWCLYIRSKIERKYDSSETPIKYSDLCSELFVRVIENSESLKLDNLKSDETKNFTIYKYTDKFGKDLYVDKILEESLLSKYNITNKTYTKEKLTGTQKSIWEENLNKNYFKIYKNDRGIRVNLDDPVNSDKIVRLLNIKATLTLHQNTNDISIDEVLSTGNANRVDVDCKYYLSTIAVITQYNLQFLTTDFWKHGQAGNIDISDKIYPTYWYGKQHPFEFEFVVAENPDTHKIFDNLEIISNKAAPHSFHYEIIGDCYDFAKDKKNMYIRQEATKELYQYNGVDIEFDESYKKLDNIPRDLVLDKKDISNNPLFYDKSTVFPLWYYRKDTINEIEDSYNLLKENNKHFDQLAGAEIVKYDNLNEYRIWNHAKGVDINKEGRIKGNMWYQEDKWKIQINPINLVLKNEAKSDWNKKFPIKNDGKLLIPAELNYFNILNNLTNIKNTLENRTLYLPSDWERNIVKWDNYELKNKEVKLKDKFIKIRIRYNGDDLAIISAIKTLYRMS